MWLKVSKKGRIISVISIITMFLTLISVAVYAIIITITPNKGKENDIPKSSTVQSAKPQKNNASVVSDTSVKEGIDSSEDKSVSSYNSNESITINTKDEDKKTNSTNSQKVTKTFSFNCKYTQPEIVSSLFNDSQNGVKLPYQIFLPENYNPSKKYPLLVFLHSKGEIGSENTAPGVVALRMYQNNADLASQAFVLCPQTASGWNIGGTLTSVVHLLDELKSKYSLDEDRFYVTGISIGGYGTWQMLSEYGNIFAAGMPLCGWGDTSKADVLKNIPIRIYHSFEDNTVSFGSSQIMYDAIVNAGGNKVDLVRLDGQGHSLSTYVFNNRDAFCWLFAQNKTKNPRGEYDYIPYFKVVDSNGKTVISDIDINDIDENEEQVGNKYVYSVDLSLTTDGKSKLSRAYASGGSKEFTVYWLDQKLYTFVATRKNADDIFTIPSILDADSSTVFVDTVRESFTEQN